MTVSSLVGDLAMSEWQVMKNQLWDWYYPLAPLKILLFFTFSVASLHDKWNRTKLLPRHTELTSFPKSCQTTQVAEQLKTWDLTKGGDFRNITKMRVDIGSNSYASPSAIISNLSASTNKAIHGEI